VLSLVPALCMRSRVETDTVSATTVGHSCGLPDDWLAHLLHGTRRCQERARWSDALVYDETPCDRMWLAALPSLIFA